MVEPRGQSESLIGLLARMPLGQMPVSIVGWSAAGGNVLSRKVGSPVGTMGWVGVVAKPEPDCFFGAVAHEIDMGSAFAHGAVEFMAGLIESDFPEVAIEFEVAEMIRAVEVVPSSGQSFENLPEFVVDGQFGERFRRREFDAI